MMLRLVAEKGKENTSFQLVSHAFSANKRKGKIKEIVPAPDSSFPDGETFPDPRPRKSLSILNQTQIKLVKIQAPDKL